MNIKDFKSPLPHKSRLSPARKDYEEIIKTHEIACLENKETYIDPSTGYSVFTAYYHLKRGNCCNSGCRHCPFNC